MKSLEKKQALGDAELVSEIAKRLMWLLLIVYHLLIM